jgi:hypothetical protein
MKRIQKIIFLLVFVYGCQPTPPDWAGPVLSQPRQHLSTAELLSGESQPLIDMSFFAKPAWAEEASHSFSGTISFNETEITFPKGKEHYPGETLFPGIEVDFISHNAELVPRPKGKINTRHLSESQWDVFIGTGKIWQEKEDSPWSRASFPLTLTDRWVGTARNCVATFVYQADSMSNVCLQCSQESADIDDQGIGNLNGILPTNFQPRQFADADDIIEEHLWETANRLPTRPLKTIDKNNEVGDFFEKKIYTNAPTSMGAILLEDTLYLHPAKTRHGLYPYPGEMRHGLYSVTKSMAGALVLLYFSQRYEDNVFDALITDYVPALAQHEGWQGVTFSHTLNMVTGTVGSESLEHFYGTVIVAETAEEAIQNVAKLGDAPELPGQRFNYASANLFVLSYAIQKFVEEKEGEEVNYWDLVRENVLIPIGAEYFSVVGTLEKDDKNALPLLGLGAMPTIGEAAKIALLFANDGSYEGPQI